MLQDQARPNGYRGRSLLLAYLFWGVGQRANIRVIGQVKAY